MIWLAFAVTLGDFRRDFFTDWPIPTAVRILPRQSILRTVRADDLLCVLIGLAGFLLRQRIFVLRVNVTATDLNRVEFIAADAAVEKFLSSCFGVEVPLGANFYDG